MKNKLSILVILSFGLIGCSSPKSSFELRESSSLRQVFSAEEINELKIAFDFFNGELCAEQQINKDCYRTFFQMLNKNNAEGFVELPISYEAQQNMYQRLSENLKTQVWSRKWTKNEVDTIGSIYIANNGKYMTYLTKCGETDDLVKRYLDELNAAGGIFPGMVEGYEYHGNESVDFHLIMAIHFLTLNDQFERKN